MRGEHKTGATSMMFSVNFWSILWLAIGQWELSLCVCVCLSLSVCLCQSVLYMSFLSLSLYPCPNLSLCNNFHFLSVCRCLSVCLSVSLMMSLFLCLSQHMVHTHLCSFLNLFFVISLSLNPKVSKCKNKIYLCKTDKEQRQQKAH